jgi:uncharacterized membrane-anchored protein
MSVRSLTTLAVERDTESSDGKTYADALIGAIPTEVLALYTFVVTAIVGTITVDDDKQLSLRWTVFAAGVAGTVVYLVVSYVRARRAARKRPFPGQEITAAAVAFAAWGLVMPGSPLMSMLSADNSRIWAAIITAAGVSLLGLLGGNLTKPAKRAK